MPAANPTRPGPWLTRFASRSGSAVEMPDEGAKPGLCEGWLAVHRPRERCAALRTAAVGHQRHGLGESLAGLVVAAGRLRLFQPLRGREGPGQLGLVISEIGPGDPVER